MASFGENLRQQREARGISLEDISAGTKIRPHFLAAMEADQFESLPRGAARGFIRSYAAFIGLNPDQVVRDYRSLLRASAYASLGIAGESSNENYREPADIVRSPASEIDEPADKCPVCQCPEYLSSRRSFREVIHGYGPMARCAHCARRYPLGPGASSFPLTPTQLKQAAVALAACLIVAFAILEGENLLQRVKVPVRRQAQSSSQPSKRTATANLPTRPAAPSERQMMAAIPMLAASLTSAPPARVTSIPKDSKQLASAASNPNPLSRESNTRPPQPTASGAPSVPAVRPLARPASRWFVQVSASISADEARETRSRLQSEGYPALLMNPDQVREDDHFVRCLVGPYRSRSVAQEARDRIHNLGLTGFVRELRPSSTRESE